MIKIIDTTNSTVTYKRPYFVTFDVRKYTVEVIDWLVENVGTWANNWSPGHEAIGRGLYMFTFGIYFEKYEDAIIFKLRWEE